MTVAVRPPEYFPRPAYIALALEADRFVLADTFEYSRRSYQNRARMRTPQGWHWVSVPLKGGQSRRPICDVEIENRERWLIKHWRSFQYNYRSTPYFEYYEPQLEPFFEQEWERLGDVACASVALVLELLDRGQSLSRTSEMEDQPDSVEAVLGHFADDTTLLVPADAAERDAPYARRSEMLEFDEPTYEQNFDGFEEGMSAVDLIFNYGPDAVSMIREGVTIRAVEEAAEGE